MPRGDERMPPPTGRGGKGAGPDMAREDPSIYGRLSQLAEQESAGAAGGEEQAGQLVMSAAQQLMQAAQMHPPLQQMVEQALGALRAGVEEMARGATGGMGEEMGGEMGGGGPPKKKRVRPPKKEREETDESAGMEGFYG